jgi:hypothetical protein
MDPKSNNNATEVALDRKALETFVVGNPDLKELETSLAQFNIFEAIGVVRQELHHSGFLAFLLDPQQNHGLGDAFVRCLLQKATPKGGDSSVPIDLIHLNEVRREWMNIDILLLDSERQIAIIVENKIDSGEHSNQLERYRESVRQQYSGWKIKGLYLTPDGDDPSDETYRPVSYTSISEILEELTNSREIPIGPEVRTLMTHYVQMLRRHLVNDSGVARLCQQIYHNHKRAIDLILEHVADQQVALGKFLEELVRQEKGLELDYCEKRYVRFLPKEWDVPVLKRGEGWTSSGRILLFELQNEAASLKIKLMLGPGPDEIRRKLFEFAKDNRPFKCPKKVLGQKWNAGYNRPFLGPKSYEGKNLEEIEKEIEKHWSNFVKKDLPELQQKLKQQKWIWESTAN